MHTHERIAVELGIAEGTVRAHLSRVFQHFGVSGHRELLAQFSAHAFQLLSELNARTDEGSSSEGVLASHR